MSNESYLTAICKELEKIPRETAILVASEIFENAVSATKIDSGQAAAQWKIEGYTGSVSMAPQEILWGFGDQEPVYPAGFKWSAIDNSEQVHRHQFETLVNVIASMPEEIDGIVVYNPITPGFADFRPGKDDRYAGNAFAAVSVDGIVSQALSSAYNEMNQETINA